MLRILFIPKSMSLGNLMGRFQAVTDFENLHVQFGTTAVYWTFTYGSVVFPYPVNLHLQ